MDSNGSWALFAPPTPSSPSNPMLHCASDAQAQSKQNARSSLQFPMSPESMRGIDLGVGDDHDGLDSKSFERAIAQLVQDRKEYSAAESKPGRQQNVYMIKKHPKMMSSPSAASVSRDSRKVQADMKRTVRPPLALAATHPALYSSPPRVHRRGMLPTPPPTDYPESKISSLHCAKIETQALPPSPPWRNYTDPNRQISGEPKFDDPKYRMLKMDLEPHRPKVLSPTFMIGLPCGGMIEAANQYPDAGHSHSRDMSIA